MNGSVASTGLIAEQIGLRTAKTSMMISINNLQKSRSKAIQRALCLCETKTANLDAIRAQLYVLYSSFGNKGNPEAISDC